MLSESPRKDWNQIEEQALSDLRRRAWSMREAWLGTTRQGSGTEWSSTGAGLSDPLGLGVLLNTVPQSYLCEIKPCAFVPNNVFTFIQQLKKTHISFPSLFCRLQFQLKFSMLSQFFAVCIRSFTLPKGITDVITQYIQISAFKDIFGQLYIIEN